MNEKKLIDILIPCYNESDSVDQIYKIISKMFENELQAYDYHMIFVDDYSTDGTRKLIRDLCT